MRRNINYNNIDEEESLVIEKNNDKKIKTKLFIWILISIFVFYQLFSLISYTLGKKDKNQMWLYNSVNSVFAMFSDKSPNKTEENYSLKFAALGDIYLTSNSIKGAKTSSSYDFSTGISKVAEKLNTFDIVSASLNTPVADSLSYTSKSTYNSPIELLDTLKKLNVSVLATASEHSMDKNEVGIIATEKALREKEIAQVGINSEARNNPIVMEKNNIKIGILSYTTSSQVKISNKKSYLVNIFNNEDIKKDIEYLKSKKVDYIVSYLYVSNENSKITSSTQKDAVNTLFENGVNVVLGTGSNAIQDTEEDLIKVSDKDSHVYVNYGLGDFMGSYATEDNRLSTIVDIEFTKKIIKDKKGEIISTITDMKASEPIGIWTKFSTKYLKTMYLIDNEVENYSNNKSDVTVKEYTELKNAKEYFDELYK